MPYQLYIGGRWQDAAGGRSSDIHNPATGERVASAAYGDVPDALAAMDAAERALPSWSRRSAHERALLLGRAADLIRERASRIARVLTEENGKPLAEAMAETTGCVDWFDWFAEEGKRVYGRMIPSHLSTKRHWVIHQPVGVVVAVNPWNFPINLMSRKLAAALAAGCTVVSRPASGTPLSSMLVFECLDEAGFPGGSVNLVTGPASRCTEAMATHRACRKISFTGSTAVGKELMQLASRRMTKVSLELGGHAPLIVFSDVDVETAALKTVVGKFRYSGQTCVAPTRIYVHESILGRFTDEVVKQTLALKVGNGLEPGIQMGPLFDARQVAATEAFIADAVDHGARVLCGGRRLTGVQYERGWFFEPTVLDRVTADMRLMREEVFGPILPLIPFTSEEEVIAAANATAYGLAAYLLTGDLGTSIRVTEALEYGVIGLNDTVPTVPHAPFGGWKESGVGREGGIEGIQAYMETKYISLGL
jgi:succinate-semialdehyde dehydrogenase/glutarate-semialdehyde dehydrogenase